MSSSPLRPPLPPPRSHDGITFLPHPSLTGESKAEPAARRLPDTTVAAIAAALSELIGAGDFTVSTDGVLVFTEPLTTEAARGSAWSIAARLEAIERATLV
jgi:hypothetical protein